MRTLGFDPGTAATGFGVVVFDAGRLELECCGVWRPPSSMALPAKLDFLFTSAFELASRIRPDAVSIETVFSAARHVASAKALAGEYAIANAFDNVQRVDRGERPLWVIPELRQ